MTNKRAANGLFGLKNWLDIRSSASHLIYPETCLICEHELTQSERSICSFCAPELEYTYFEKYTEPTELDKLFWGRVKIEHTFSLLYFRKEKSTQKILHTLKYAHSPHIGVEFGRIIGRTLKQHSQWKEIDMLVPVPIHPKKEFQRGYNQSEQLAIGISDILSIPVDTDLLTKKLHTGSQTKKGRFDRWDNVSSVFRIGKSTKTPQHIAIVDDVITTGATLESIVRTVQENYPDIRVSIISLALTK
jgi:ComF family protein